MTQTTTYSNLSELEVPRLKLTYQNKPYLPANKDGKTLWGSLVESRSLPPLPATKEVPNISSLQREPRTAWAKIQTSSLHLNSAQLLFCQGHPNVYPFPLWSQYGVNGGRWEHIQDGARIARVLPTPGSDRGSMAGTHKSSGNHPLRERWLWPPAPPVWHRLLQVLKSPCTCA